MRHRNLLENKALSSYSLFPTYLPERSSFDPDSDTPASRLGRSFEASARADRLTEELSEAAKLEVVSRFAEKNPTLPLAQRILEDMRSIEPLLNPRGRFQRLEAIVVGPKRLSKGLGAIASYYPEVAKVLAERGEIDEFLNLHTADPSAAEETPL